MEWISKNKLEVVIVLLILALAVFLRFYRLPEYMTFLGDEGRDAIIIKKILTESDIPFIGPPTSVGNIYLGPLYYYMMTIPMAIFWLNPVAAAGMVAFIGTATVALIYYLSRVWFGINAAVIASLLYAVSPVTIIYSRSSWNPNPAPFFSLLAIVSFYLAKKKSDYRWFILTGIAVASAVQMHYLAFMLLLVILLLWFVEVKAQFKEKKPGKYFILGSIGGAMAFLLLISPLILFDWKHNFLNYRGLVALFTGQNSTVGIGLSFLTKTLSIYLDSLIGRYITTSLPILTIFVGIIIFLLIVWNVYQSIIKKQLNWPFSVLIIWLTIGLVGMSLYRQEVYDHYLGFLNPVPFMLLGSLSKIIPVPTWKVGTGLFRISLVSLVLILLILNLRRSPLQYPPNNQLSRTQEISRVIIKQADGQPFNFALLAKNNYDAAYQFYLDIYGFKPKVLPVEVTSQLFVVCEDPVCTPINNPKYEIAAFGWAKIADTTEAHGAKIYKLVSNPEGKPI